MLVLARNAGDGKIMIGEDITVSVLGVKGNQVRIGIEAPSDVAVHREEIYDRIKAEKEGRTVPVPKIKVDQKYSGFIDKYFPDKGFGFIESNIANTGIYFHASNVADMAQISEGIKVVFNCDNNEKGLFATNITIS